MLPKMMLRKLYVKGSLKQEGEEFTFQILNKLASGTVIHVDPLKVDDQEYPLENTTVEFGEKKFSATEISKEKPFILKKGLAATFRVKGTLEQGEHTLDISFQTSEVGKIAFDVKDEL